MFRIILSIALIGIFLAGVQAQTTAFTYQGSLKDGANPANGNYDLEFKLFDQVSGGAQQGSTLQRLNVAVANGIFTVTLDFGGGPIPSFPGADRFLDIAVRTAGGGAFTPLSPRQKVNSAPYSVRSLNATSATNATQLGGVAANQYVVTTDPRMTDARDPLPGSNNYIRNSGAQQQAGANLWISGSGNFGGGGNFDSGLSVGGNFIVGGNTTLTGNLTINGSLTGNLPSGDTSYVQNRQTAQPGTTNFNISGNGTVGGTLNATTVSGNIFSAVTVNSSVYNIGGSRVLNNLGTQNIAVGVNSGAAGADNSFFGFNAGNGILAAGTDNSFFGSDAGGINSTGLANSFFGSDTGDSNTTGSSNSFFGRSAGGGNSTGSSNAFFGHNAGLANTTGSNNTLVGYNAGVAIGNLTYATAIGADSAVLASNTIALGRTDGSDIVRVYGDLVVNGRIAIGTFGPTTSTNLCVANLGVVSLCSSSIRYKNSVASLGAGLDVVSRLRPVTFKWNESGEKDLGLIAEETEAIDPLLVTYNKDGQIQGVKYDQLTVVLVNAVKEQQAQIEKQQSLIEKLEKRLEQLEKKENK